MKGTVKGTVLITGAAGEVGRRLVSRVVADGWRVRALVLPGDPLRHRLDGLPAEICEGDVRDRASLPAAVRGVDSVLHLAAVILARDPSLYEEVNHRGTVNMVAAAAEAGVRHFIYVSSASVVYPRLTPYGRSKLSAEEAVKAEARLAHTIVRPTLVYDETGGQEFLLFRRYLRRFPVVPFIGPLSGPRAARKRPVHAEDVVDGLARILGNEAARGQTYNLSGGETITLPDLGRLVLELEGASRPFLPLPVWACRLAAHLLARVMANPPLTPYGVAGFTNHADLDPSTAMRDLGYHPRGVRTGLAACLRPAAADSATSAADAPAAPRARSFSPSSSSLPSSVPASPGSIAPGRSL